MTNTCLMRKTPTLSPCAISGYGWAPTKSTTSQLPCTRYGVPLSFHWSLQHKRTRSVAKSLAMVARRTLGRAQQRPCSADSFTSVLTMLLHQPHFVPWAQNYGHCPLAPLSRCCVKAASRTPLQRAPLSHHFTSKPSVPQARQHSSVVMSTEKKYNC
jgi:hypothetical protein